MRINLLLNNNFFKDHCTYSFIYPILNSIYLIRESGNNLNFFYSLKKDIFDYDILIIDSRFTGKIKNKEEFIKYSVKILSDDNLYLKLKNNLFSKKGSRTYKGVVTDLLKILYEN